MQLEWNLILKLPLFHPIVESKINTAEDIKIYLSLKLNTKHIIYNSDKKDNDRGEWQDDYGIICLLQSVFSK